MSYVVNGNMTKGHALLAYPESYGDTGIHVYVIGSDGTIHQRDFGEDTASFVEELTEYDPDPNWQVAW